MYVIEVYDRDELEYTQGYFPSEEEAEDFAKQYEVDAGRPGHWYQVVKR